MPYRQDFMPTSEHVYRKLREMILSLKLPPNFALGEQAVADRVQVSRTPVREALGRLSSEGLVDIYPRRGAIVAPIRLSATHTAQFVRETLEAAIVRRAAENSTPIGVLTLRQSLEEQKLAEKENEPEIFYRSDERMHRRICKIAGCDPVWRLIEDAKIHMDRVRKLTLRPVKVTELIRQHEGLVEAIEAKDANLAEQRIREHLQAIFPDMDRLIKEHPDYFDLEGDNEDKMSTQLIEPF